MRYKVIKGSSQKKAELDSTWPDKSRADDRAETLRKGLRKGIRGRRILVWVVTCEEEDPHNYRKPIRGPYTNYDGPRRGNVIKKGYAKAKK